jgi:type VI secretion system protein ImpJ
MTRRLVEVLTTRGNALARMRRERAKGVADFGIMDVTNFWFLYTLNSHLPVIKHILDVRRGHAGDLYRAMLSLAGTLSTFSGSIGPADLPAYDHTDLTECFGRMDELLHGLLDTVVPSSHVALPFSVERPTIHRVSPDRDRYYRGPEIYLAVQAGVQEGELVQKVPQLVKLTSPDRIDQLVSSARDGVSLIYAPDPPPAVPIRLGYQYFRLDRSGPDWDAIRRTRSLAAYVPDVFVEARLELVILLPAEE